MIDSRRKHFEKLVLNYPSEIDVWTWYGHFHGLVHDESGAEECRRRLAYLQQTCVVEGNAVRAKTKEEEEKEISQAKMRENAPYEFLCPITLEIMRSPVNACDGFTYQYSLFHL